MSTALPGRTAEDEAGPAGGGLRRVAAARRRPARHPPASIPDADPVALPDKPAAKACKLGAMHGRRTTATAAAATASSGAPADARRASLMFGSAGLRTTSEPARATGKRGQSPGPSRQSLGSSPSTPRLVAFSASLPSPQSLCDPPLSGAKRAQVSCVNQTNGLVAARFVQLRLYADVREKVMGIIPNVTSECSQE